MARTRTWAVTWLVALGVAFLLGYWPQYSQRRTMARELAALDARVRELEARVRLGRLLGDLLHLTETVAAMNYGDAQAISSRFFDGVAAEAATTPVAEFRAALEEVARQRDRVTAALARGDPAALEPLRAAHLALRQALGYPVARGSATEPSR